MTTRPVQQHNLMLTTLVRSREANSEDKTEVSHDLASVYVEVEGFAIPRFFETNRPMAEHIQCLKALEMRHDDVMIVTFPKSGTHMAWEMVSMLVSGRADYERRTKDFAMVEAVEIENIRALPTPRVLNSHLPMRLLPHQVKDKQVKVIHVYRNVKDAVVSGYFHFKQLPLPVFQSWTIDSQLLGTCCSSEVPGWKYVEFLKEMEEYQKHNPEVPFFTIAFEDIIEDPQKAVRDLAKFLGVEASPALCHDIAEATRFAKLKEADKQKQRGRLSTLDIFRKGKVGDWKNHLTVAQCERLDAEVTQLESCDYHFRYTL